MLIFRHQMTVSYLNPFLEIYRAWQSFLEHDNCLALLLIKLDFSDTECNGRFPNFWIWNTYGWVEKKKNTYNSSILIGIKQNLNTSFRKRNQIYNTDNTHIWIQNESTSVNRIPTSDLHLSMKQREIFDSDDSVACGEKCLLSIKQKFPSKSLFNNFLSTTLDIIYILF